MDTNLQDAFDAGRTSGTAKAKSAIHQVLKRYAGDEHHEIWMALMEAIEAIQDGEPRS